MVRKRVIITALIVLLVMSFNCWSALAVEEDVEDYLDEVEEDKNDGDIQVDFSLEQCIERALENNTMLKIENMKYKKAQVEKSEAKFTSERIEDLRDNIKVKLYVPELFTFEGGAQGKDLLPALKDAEELVAKKTLKLEEQKLRIEVEKAYYSALLAEDNLKVAHLNLDRAKQQHKNAQVSFENGVIAKDSLLMAQYGLADASAGITSAEKSRELAYMNLNKVMGRELTAPIKLTSGFVYRVQEIPDIEGLTASALSLRPEVINMREMGDVSELNAKLVRKYYGTASYKYKKAYIDYMNAKLGVKETEDAITLAVKAAHLNVIDTAEKLTAAGKMKEMAAESYRVVDLKYKNQMATLTEVLESLSILNKAEMGYSAAVHNYNVACAELDNWAGKGLED